MSVPDRPAFDDAAIWVRPEGRQLCITTGQVDDDDRGEDPPGTRVPQPDEDAGPGGTRQPCTGFSDRSRRNLRDTVHSLDREAHCLFLTLTYHQTDPHPREAKSHLDEYCKWILRVWPGTSIVWKMEPQKRGVVHFHLMVYGITFAPISRLCGKWHRVTDEESVHHRKQGVDVERGVHREDGKLAAYLAKYLGKTFSVDWENPGRFWGVRGREDLPRADWEKLCVVDRDEAVQIIYDLLNRWGVSLPEHTDIPKLTVNCRGDPADYIATLP